MRQVQPIQILIQIQMLKIQLTTRILRAVQILRAAQILRAIVIVIHHQMIVVRPR